MRALRSLIVCCYLASLSGQVIADVAVENSANSVSKPRRATTPAMMADMDVLARSGLILPLPDVPEIAPLIPVVPHLSQRKVPMRSLFSHFELIVAKALTVPIVPSVIELKPAAPEVPLEVAVTVPATLHDAEFPLPASMDFIPPAPEVPMEVAVTVPVTPHDAEFPLPASMDFIPPAPEVPLEVAVTVPVTPHAAEHQLLAKVLPDVVTEEMLVVKTAPLLHNSHHAIAETHSLERFADASTPAILFMDVASTSSEPDVMEPVRHRVISEFYDPEFDVEEGQEFGVQVQQRTIPSVPRLLDKKAIESDALNRPKAPVLASPTEPSDNLTRKTETPKRVKIVKPIVQPIVVAASEQKTSEHKDKHDLSSLPVTLVQEPPAKEDIPQATAAVVASTALPKEMKSNTLAHKPKIPVLASPTEPADILTRKIAIPERVKVVKPVVQPMQVAALDQKLPVTQDKHESEHDLSSLPVTLVQEPPAEDEVQTPVVATNILHSEKHAPFLLPKDLSVKVSQVPLLHDFKSESQPLANNLDENGAHPKDVLQLTNAPAPKKRSVTPTKIAAIKNETKNDVPYIEPTVRYIIHNRLLAKADHIEKTKSKIALEKTVSTLPEPVIITSETTTQTGGNVINTKGSIGKGQPEVVASTVDNSTIQKDTELITHAEAAKEQSKLVQNVPEPEKTITHKPPPPGVPELSLTQLRINNTDIIDLEVLIWKDGSVSYPIKTISQLFLANNKILPDGSLVIEDTTSHQTLSVNTDTQKMFVSGTPWTIPGPPIVEKNNGLIIADDIYVPAAIIDSIFMSNLTFSQDSLIADLSTTRKLYIDSNALVDNIDGQNEHFDDDDKEISLSTVESKNILERISYRSSSRYNARYSQFRSILGNNGASKNSATNMQNNFELQLSGHIAGLPYYIEPTWYSLGSQASLQGLAWAITKNYQHGKLTLGSVDMKISPVVSPNSSLWGLNYATHNAVNFEIDSKKTVKSPPKKEKTAEVFTQHFNHHFLNDHSDLDGRTTAEKLNETIKSAVTSKNNIVAGGNDPTKPADETEILNAPNSKPEVKEHYFDDVLEGRTKAYSAWIGQNAPRFNPVTLTGSSRLFVPQSNKIVTGGRYYYGLTDRLTFGLSASADKIYGKPKTQDLLTTYFTSYTPDLTGVNSYRRDNNFFEGTSLGTSLKYKLSQHFALRGDVSGSYYTQKPGASLPLPNTGNGDAENAMLEYKAKQNNTTLNVFRYSSDYYTPSQFVDASTYDRRGVGLNTTGFWQKAKLSYQFGYQRYQSNTAARFTGGIINANHYRANLNRTFFKNLNAGGTIDWIDGQNDLQKYILRTTDIFARKPIFNNILLETRYRQQETENIYIPFNSTDALSHIYSILNNTQSIRSFYNSVYIPFGRENYVKVGQNLSNLISYASIEGHLKIKNIILEPFIQKSFASIQQEDRLGGRIYYQFPSGMRVGLTYYYNQLDFGNAKYNTHQFYFDLMDVLGVVGSNLISMGRGGNINANLLTGKLFIDTNRNSLYDNNEPGIPNVEVLVDNTNKIKTNKNGLFVTTSLSPGDHSLEIEPDDLPINVIVSNTKYKVAIQKDVKNQQVNIGFTPEGSRIIGRVSIEDIDKNKISFKQMIIYLLDDKNNLISYTTTDSSGNYQFSDIPPGNYKIDLSEQAKNSGKYKIITNLPIVNIALDVKTTEPTIYEQEDLKLLQLF